jgi:hypothetical protein
MRVHKHTVNRGKRAHRYGAHTLQDGEHTRLESLSLSKIANKYHPSGAIIGDWRYLIEIETDLEETKVESTDSSRHTLTRSLSAAEQSPLSLFPSLRAEAERTSASRSDFVANSGQKCFTRTWHSALIAPTPRCLSLCFVVSDVYVPRVWTVAARGSISLRPRLSNAAARRRRRLVCLFILCGAHRGAAGCITARALAHRICLLRSRCAIKLILASLVCWLCKFSLFSDLILL